ncbi:MAG TPA: ribose 5-phosphate isomerase B [Spirochaetota bacterium]|nr:ribose 5-phosphate isomerase B [Spirochaetota bacterium]HOS32934.1 ribose 5-phosphate isomerase B [Spirochaetota bacterium]HOS55506.1 ribose 5-phosphate isomerase B [Spirochaetota bacterium]HPK62787.1 ribose 5-phosphate isomerase B [Spirochaetota bacterium]HQF78121.1 ribose 5-phosphate isomerase B [Spirochaetota bacterium]
MIFIGCDHGGYELKMEIYNYVKGEMRLDITDMGCFSKDSVDYPDIAEVVAKSVLEKNGVGILICGTGVGISIAANKICGVRCALCSEEYSARMTRKHNDANILALGGRTTGVELAKSIVNTFLTTGFEGGRHQKRIDKISSLEKNSSL